MTNLVQHLSNVLEIDVVQSLSKGLVVILVGLLLAKTVNRRLRASSHQSQSRLLIRRFITGIILTITFAWALSLAGVDVSVLLGTAGFLTIAIGFAAQTSVSNLISGVFLMAEKPFRVGDTIEVAGTKGEVLVIDLMSVKLRTFDNLLLRIPNEMMLKASLTNLTHFEIRRYDLPIGVAYKEDTERVRKVLLQVAHDNPLCLEDPKPLVLFLGFGDSAVNFQYSVWAKQSSFLDLRNSIAEEVKRSFEAEGIEIPFPHRTLHVGSTTGPFPVQGISESDVARDSS